MFSPLKVDKLLRVVASKADNLLGVIFDFFGINGTLFADKTQPATNITIIQPESFQVKDVDIGVFLPAPAPAFLILMNNKERLNTQGLAPSF